jgi:SNF2 family DNA or RNA helicase
MELFDFQQEVLEQSKNLNKVAYYFDMGLGKTYIGAEKLVLLNATVNLVVCQKSKIDDWIKHLVENYPTNFIFDLTIKKQFESFVLNANENLCVPFIGIINYELLIRRPELSKLKDFTLLLDESSLIQNENSKRSRFILKTLKPKNIILLSGTPTGGKYEKLWSQLYLLGYKISKRTYWDEYVDYYKHTRFGFPLTVINGYKNVDRLKAKMAEYGCFFKKTDEVFSLPEQNFIDVSCKPNKGYRDFKKNSIVSVYDGELVGDTTLSKLLYERQLCGVYSDDKIAKLKDLLSSTDDRVIIFYNFTKELHAIEDICFELDKPTSIVNGESKDLACYEEYANAVTMIQYQAGAMGLNLQKANKIIYFTPTLSSELFEQSKKRTHRIGQEKPCFYYQLVCKDSVEEKIYSTLAKRKDFTEKLFEKGEIDV